MIGIMTRLLFHASVFMYMTTMVVGIDCGAFSPGSWMINTAPAGYAEQEGVTCTVDAQIALTWDHMPNAGDFPVTVVDSKCCLYAGTPSTGCFDPSDPSITETRVTWTFPYTMDKGGDGIWVYTKQEGGPGGLGEGFSASCPYVIKPLVSAALMEETRCVEDATDCLTKFHCGTDNTLGLAESDIEYVVKKRSTHEDSEFKTQSEKDAVAECQQAAVCLKASSAIGDVDSFKRINNAALPSGCAYMPSRKRLVYNLARGNFGFGAAEGFQSICKAEQDTTKKAEDERFHLHDFPISDATHELMTSECGPKADGLGPIRGDKPSRARIECQFAVEALNMSHATKKAKTVNWPKKPHGCIVNTGNGRVFYNKNNGKNIGAVWNEWKVVCRKTEPLESAKRQKRKDVHSFW